MPSELHGLLRNNARAAGRLPRTCRRKSSPGRCVAPAMREASRRKNAASPPVVYIATSAGGHIDLLVAVRAAFAGYGRVWVVQPSLRAGVLARDGEDVIVLPEVRPPPDARPLRLEHRPVGAHRASATAPGSWSPPAPASPSRSARSRGSPGAKSSSSRRWRGSPARARPARCSRGSRRASLVQWPEAWRPTRARSSASRRCSRSLTSARAAHGHGHLRRRSARTASRSTASWRMVDDAVGQGRPARTRSSPRAAFHLPPAQLRAARLADPGRGGGRDAETRSTSSATRAPASISCALRAGRRPLVLPRLRATASTSTTTRRRSSRSSPSSICRLARGRDTAGPTSRPPTARCPVPTRRHGDTLRRRGAAARSSNQRARPTVAAGAARDGDPTGNRQLDG